MTGFSLTNVHLSCFVASYAAALLLELARLFLRSPARLLGTLGFAAAGVVAQTIYIGLRTNPAPSQAPPLSSWFDWLLLVAWGVAVVYLVISLRRPQAAYGVFMLPLVLVLIAVAAMFRDAEPFPRDQALYVWGMVHGMALLLGSVIVMLGFIAGVMYLVQSVRLKKKLPPPRGLKLPSLEWLQQATQRTLWGSSWLLAAGLLAGVVLNLLQGPGGLPWTDPVVWTSGILLLWLIAVLIFESAYKPAQQGRKVAYLTVASFVFLALVLGMVLLAPSRHASPPSEAGGPSSSAFADRPWGGGTR
jgi:ABC-type transport system involved in cytochrome c biogenesis permease subunit